MEPLTGESHDALSNRTSLDFHGYELLLLRKLQSDQDLCKEWRDKLQKKIADEDYDLGVRARPVQTSSPSRLFNLRIFVSHGYPYLLVRLASDWQWQNCKHTGTRNVISDEQPALSNVTSSRSWSWRYYINRTLRIPDPVSSSRYHGVWDQKIKFVWNVLILIALDRAFQMEQNDTNISYMGW